MRFMKTCTDDLIAVRPSMSQFRCPDTLHCHDAYTEACFVNSKATAGCFLDNFLLEPGLIQLINSSRFNVKHAS